MKAAIYQGKENIEIRELPNPTCEDDGVILENIYASILIQLLRIYK